MYLSIIGDSCNIMSIDYELTVNYDMISSLGKGWFQIDRYDYIAICNMCLKCVNSARNMVGIRMTR